MPRIYGTLGAVDETTRTVEILASTPQPVDGEALVTWDLTRFLKHPTILWAHDGDCLPVGRAEESTVRIDAEGLKMRCSSRRPRRTRTPSTCGSRSSSA